MARIITKAVRTRAARPGVALLALAATSAAQAFGYAAIAHNGAAGAVTETVATGRAHVSSTRTLFNGSDTRWSYIASAYGDVDRGAVGASVIAEKSGPSGFLPLTVHTWSTAFDNLTFSGPRAAEVVFTATVSGSFAAAVDSSTFFAGSWLYFGGTQASADFRYTHHPLSPERRASVQTSGAVSAIVDEISGLSATLTARRLVQPGEVLSVQADLAMRVTPANYDIAVANFGHTVQLSYELPPGFSFTSASGSFMTLPPAPVPEPPTALLGLIGWPLLRRWMAYRQA